MKKIKPKSVKKRAVSNGSSNSKEKAYLQAIDFREWWEEFATGMRKNGTQKYPTVWSFIKSKAKHGWQRDLLYWVLGPEATKGDSKYSSFPQFDWNTKRERGFWFSSTNIENLRSEIKRKATSFDRLQTAGESLIDDLAELSELQKQVSKEFGNRLFLPDNTTEENTARVNLYMQLRSQMQEMKAHILQTFAKTQGMDMNQLTGFLEVFANGMGQAASRQLGYGGGQPLLEGDKAETSYNRVLTQLCDMTLKKSADLELELPSDAERAVKESINGKGKRVVQ